VEGLVGDLGDRAERIAEERIRAALPAEARCYANVRFVARTRPTGPAHDGEADIVIVHPEHGLLVIEVKSGQPSRDAQNRWFIGGKQLTRSPFKQAEDAKHDLVGAIGELLAVHGDDRPRAGHAVAFPDADLASLPAGHVLLGPDTCREIILDAAALGDATNTRKALERAWAWWTGDGTKGRALTPAQEERVNAYLAPTVELRRLLRHDVEDAKDRLLVASRVQLIVLNQNRSRRRAEVIGPAGSGKSLIAIEKARRLARDGFRTLFVCFNQPLATSIIRAIEDDGEPEDRRPLVTTFHRLCEVLGRRAGVLPPKPNPIPVAWWNETLPGALDQAIDRLPDERFHAIVVDEGQDFELAWLTSLEFLFRTPADGVFWVFHDPGQALRTDDRVGELGLERLELAEDYRSPAPVAEFAGRFYRGPVEPYAMGEAGRAPAIVEAAAGRATVEEVRRQLHRLVEEEGVRPWQIAVLSGQSARESEVWHQRRFGNVELWNGAVDDDGNSKGLPADEVPDEPADAGIVLFESIRRFKGLERGVVIVCELPEEGERLDQLLYTAFTRATAHLVVIAPPALAARFRG
jgi:hypothetical protein